ncbi:MAG: glutathione S-transferase family protein [Acetobacteraceae bacterium]|nr:glutathione S-transferase family protein [Acetobacteraceae bacterium]
MKLYYSPGACSIGIHVLLEELGAPYESQVISLAKGQQREEPFATVNPKGKVPVLERSDGSVLTEFPAISYWLARSNPAAKLFPDDLGEQARVLETIDYVVATIHMQGFARMFRPENFGPNEADREAVQSRGREIARNGLALLDKTLGQREYVAGSQFSIADAALFYVEFWAGRLNIELPPNLARHYARLRERPAVQRVIAKENVG